MIPGCAKGPLQRFLSHVQLHGCRHRVNRVLDFTGVAVLPRRQLERERGIGR